jgi:hypothetical protein
MTVDLNVLDHLADGLYSSVAAVLTEAVANAWDADAKKVEIQLDIENDKISVTDDGIGMDRQAVNERYLRVGYRRRKEGDKTASGRSVMGRKGIGKLSLFSIAEIIDLQSKALGKPPEALRINYAQLRGAMEIKSPAYYPTPISIRDEDIDYEHGTKILVSSLKKNRLQEMAPESLRRRLARRFSIIGSESFRVFVNGGEVTAADREDLKFVEYLWSFGDDDFKVDACENLKNHEKLDARLTGWDESWRVKGWIGTVDKPKRLATNEGNLNSVVVLARGRLVDEDVLPRTAGAKFYTKYITGQIDADFLDDSDGADIVTSNRQRVIENDERVRAVIAFLKQAMATISEAWDKLRTKDKTSELRIKFPGMDEWLKGLKPAWQDKAEKLLEKIAVMELGNDERDHEEAQKTLLRHAIFGFERLRLRGNAEELEIALGKGVDALLSLLADKDSFEASLYRDIVTNRLEVIQEFKKLVDENHKERVLQTYLFEHLWLLDPAWERAAGSPAMEKRLQLHKAFKDNDDTKNKYGRVDIRYRTVAGKHVIVELKKASVNTELYTLAKQGVEYVKALKDIVAPEDKDNIQIEVVFVVGKKIDEPAERIENTMNGVAPGSRIVPYNLLIDRSLQAYDEYLEAAGKADKIEKLFR